VSASERRQVPPHPDRRSEKKGSRRHHSEAVTHERQANDANQKNGADGAVFSDTPFGFPGQGKPNTLSATGRSLDAGTNRRTQSTGNSGYSVARQLLVTFYWPARIALAVSFPITDSPEER
jgi:hypothetical protein